jgi:drug/metabolite transporter (DMT)-like permease
VTGPTRGNPSVGGDSGVAHQPRAWLVQYGALCLIWGASFLFIKLGLEAFAPLQIASLRVFAGAVILLVLAAVTGTRLPSDRRTWWHLQATALFLCTVPFSLFAFGEERVSSALAGVGNAITPVATVLLSLVFLRTESLPPRKIAGVVGGFAGVLLVLQPWQSSGRPDPVGFAMTLMGGSSYAIGWIYNRRFLGGSRDLGGLAQPTAQLVVASGQLLVVVTGWWAVRRAISGAAEVRAPWSPLYDGAPVLVPLIAVLALGMVGTGVAFALQYDVVRAVGPTVAATVTYVLPLVAVALGVLVLGEHVTPLQLLGGTVIIGSGALVQRAGQGVVGRVRQDVSCE